MANAELCIASNAVALQKLKKSKFQPLPKQNEESENAVMTVSGKA